MTSALYYIRAYYFIGVYTWGETPIYTTLKYLSLFIDFF